MKRNLYSLNNRYYRIIDTGKPYKRGYPEINDGATHLTMNTGFRIQSFLTKSWGNICSSESFEDAAETILMFGRVRPPKGITATQCLNNYVVSEIPDFISKCDG